MRTRAKCSQRNTNSNLRRILGKSRGESIKAWGPKQEAYIGPSRKMPSLRVLSREPTWIADLRDSSSSSAISVLILLHTARSHH